MDRGEGPAELRSLPSFLEAVRLLALRQRNRARALCDANLFTEKGDAFNVWDECGVEGGAISSWLCGWTRYQALCTFGHAYVELIVALGPRKDNTVEVALQRAFSSGKECGLLGALPKNFVRQISSGLHPLKRNLASWSVRTSGDLITVKAPHHLGGLSAKLSLNSSLKLFQEHLYSKPLLFDVKVRGFKTDRNVHAEVSRSPGFNKRLKQLLGLEKAAPKPVVPEKNGQLGAETMESNLKNLMSAENATPEELEKLKVAFAEGYLSGQKNVKSPGKSARWLKLVQQLLTIVLFLSIFISLMASANGSMFRIQLGNQVEVDPEEIHVTFNDVKGADEAKQELKDVVEFLKSPDKFSALGGKLPKGVLLVGPPGTGKTLLARAVAGEAGVPFFHAAGPEFDEILVGQGARRVRDLFKAAKDRAPCVIFIDEIDSVGAKRTNSVLHPYANQTINQLLSEMDGFHQNDGVIVLGATNRRDDLDKALLRPGRFDVEVNVPTPDLTGRKEILTLYLGRVRTKSVDVELLARGTTGFTGADLENMVNQAALKAAIDGADSVTMKYLENARDKVLMGPERKSRIPDEETNEITAYHEGGHTIVAYHTKGSHPLHKVTIIPRGPSLGHTAYMPEKESYHVTKKQLLAMMDTMMGGRAAEEIIFGSEKITSGASNDLKQATAIATAMVMDWGMSESMGLRTHDVNSKSLITVNDLSPSTTDQIDNEIKKILQDSYDRAKAILKTHQKEHKLLAEALLKYETLDADDIKTILSGEGSDKFKT